jgi:sugar phosphate permease
MSAARSRPPVFFGWWIVSALFLLYFVSGGLFNTATVYFKALTAEFGWSRGELSAAFAVGFLVSGLSAPFWGRIADRMGPRSALLPGALLSGVLCVALSQITGLVSLYVLYVLFTFAATGISLIPISVVISNWFVEKRGRAMGIAYTGVGFGSLVLVPVAGVLVESFGWRTAYVASGLTVLLVLTPIALWIRNRPEDLGLLPDGREPSTLDPGMEREEPEPRSGLSLGDALRTPTFWMLTVTWLVAMMPLAAVNLHQVPFLTDLGLSTRAAALAAGTVGGMSIIGRIGFGFLSERYPIQRIYASCYFLMAVGMASLWATSLFGVPALVLYAAFFGVAVGGALALSPLLVGDFFGMRALGEVFGLLGLAATIGGAVGGTGAGFLFDRTGSYDVVFALCVGLVLFGCALMLMVRRPRLPGSDAAHAAPAPG